MFTGLEHEKKDKVQVHGSSPPHHHHNFRDGDLKISDQNNWGEPGQKIKFGRELNLRGDLKC